LAALGAAAVVLGLSALRFLAPTTGRDVASDEYLAVGSVDDYPPNTVTYLPEHHLFMVNWGGGLRALDENPDLDIGSMRCGVKYYPPSSATGVKLGLINYESGGLFKSDCDGAHFNWWRGEDVSPNSVSGLCHYDVDTREGEVFVDTSIRIPFTWVY
jgi:hypothetical protein